MTRDWKVGICGVTFIALGFLAYEPEHYVFPACEHQIDPTKPQKSFRTSWPKLTIAASVPGFRFHDLRHQAITEMSEAGATDATMMAVAGHVSKKMLEHYSHVRMLAKRNVLDKIGQDGMRSDGCILNREPTHS